MQTDITYCSVLGCPLAKNCHRKDYLFIVGDKYRQLVFADFIEYLHIGILNKTMCEVQLPIVVD